MMLRCYPILGKFKFNYESLELGRNNFPKPFTYSISSNHHNLASHSEPLKPTHDSPLSGLEFVMMDYIFGKRKATEVAHSIWKHVVQKGDAVVDATCGNGYDTLAMANMVADESCSGHVYSMDIQETALQNTMNLLDKSLDPHKGPKLMCIGNGRDTFITYFVSGPKLINRIKMVELFATCHSKMEQVVPLGIPVRLVAFNLGYLPGGDKTVITKSETTLLGMKAASQVLASGGLISVLVYVGHPGGMEECEVVEGFASGLPVNEWICCKLQMVNRPLAPVLVLLCKR